MVVGIRRDWSWGPSSSAASLLIAIWVSQRPLRATVSRRLVAPRVARGDPIRLVYRLHNTTRFRSGRATIIDRCDGEETRVTTGSVSAHTTTVAEGAIATRRRGVFEVGPLAIERIDPFWLTVGTRLSTSTATVVIHPKVYDLVGPQGAVRTIESESVMRRASADPMSGFVSMREYVAGDDPRMIHWPTSARAGTLMVREHVEVRRPEFTVVLDTAESVGSATDFEELVDVAASLAIHAIRSGLDVVVRTTDRTHAGRPFPILVEAMVLDLLTPVRQSDDENLLSVASLFTGGFDHTSVLIVTGPSGPSSRFGAVERMTVVRIGEGAVAAPGIAFAAASAPEFVERWRNMS